MLMNIIKTRVDFAINGVMQEPWFSFDSDPSFPSVYYASQITNTEVISEQNYREKQRNFWISNDFYRYSWMN